MDCDDGTLHVMAAMRGRLEMMIMNLKFPLRLCLFRTVQYGQRRPMANGMQALRCA